MNCQDFSSIVNELASYELMDAGTREAGRSHAVICGQCAARLMDAQAVNSGLLTAAGAETAEAPARVKQSLLAAFAAQQTANGNRKEAAAAPGVVIEIASWRKRPRWIAAAGVAAAAVLLIALLLPALLRTSKPEPQTQATKTEVAPSGSTTKGVAPAPQTSPESPLAGGSNTSADKKPSNYSRDRTPALVRNNTPRSQKNVRSATATVAATVRKSVSNDYFPLTGDGEWNRGAHRIITIGTHQPGIADERRARGRVGKSRSGIGGRRRSARDPSRSGIGKHRPI
jgi:hypothetical protein